MWILIPLFYIGGVWSLDCVGGEREFEGKCYKEFDKTPCPAGQWIAAGQDCQIEPCPLRCSCMDGFVRKIGDQQCHRLHTQGFCDTGKIITIINSKIRCILDPCNKGEPQIPWNEDSQFFNVASSDQDLAFDEGPKLNRLQMFLESKKYFEDYECVDITTGDGAISDCLAVKYQDQITCLDYLDKEDLDKEGHGIFSNLTSSKCGIKRVWSKYRKRCVFNWRG